MVCHAQAAGSITPLISPNVQSVRGPNEFGPLRYRLLLCALRAQIIAETDFFRPASANISAPNLVLPSSETFSTPTGDFKLATRGMM
jgi:hypothetical protein